MTTLKRHRERAEGADHSAPFAGVSSYSKILSLVDPERYAILDARVVVALNAIQVLAGTSDGLAFPCIAGRNNITGNQRMKRGFAMCPRYSVGTLVQVRRWQRVERPRAYHVYTDLLCRCRAQSSAVPSFFQLEMALPSQAEALAIRVEPTLESQARQASQRKNVFSRRKVPLTMHRSIPKRFSPKPPAHVGTMISV